jgi:uncharacterized membrane protein YdbT with pleckstrin-like domain
MSSVAENLVGNEKIVYHAHVHWILFFRPVLVLSISILMISFSEYAPSIAEYIRYLAYIVFAVGGVLFMNEYIKHRSHEYVVTDRRVFIKEGVFNTKSTTINLNHIETVELSQTLMGRILDFGEIEITASGGAGTEKPLHYIAHPAIFRKRIQAYVGKKTKDDGKRN